MRRVLALCKTFLFLNLANAGQDQVPSCYTIMVKDDLVQRPTCFTSPHRWSDCAFLLEEKQAEFSVQ